MSSISQIFSSYRSALTFSRERFEELYGSRAHNAYDFCQQFFHQLICRFDRYFADAATRRIIHQEIERFFGTKQIDFVAIDGTCAKDPFQEFIVFSACAYGAKGQIDLNDDPPTVRYQKWTIDKDVSMVTYLPLSFSEFADVIDSQQTETFLVSDSDRVNLTSIDTKIMELAEVYLAYSVATSSALETSRVIMMDRSPSSMIADLALQPADIPMVHYPFDQRRLTIEDATVALAHPFNPKIGVPTLKNFRQYMALIAEFHYQKKKAINLNDFAVKAGIERNELASALNYLTSKPDHAPFAQIEQRGNAEWLVTNVDCVASWDYCLRLFERICHRLFIEKDQMALLYDTIDEDGNNRQRWMSPDDIRFLIAVGLRALIEKCWERKILLTGIIKDSASRYLIRNYLGVMKHIGDQGYPELAPLDVKLLPWSDRAFMELLPLFDKLPDEPVNAPWASIEFDSTYMTLHAEEGGKGRAVIAGVKQFIVAPERLFARSLAQFYLRRDKSTPLMGHVVFVDRLVYPEWDAQGLDKVEIKSRSLGRIKPLCYRSSEDVNIGQVINMYLLSVLTQNHFPEVVGYPDPLHKADWGAKSLGKRLRTMIESSVFEFRSKPLSRTFRTIRESFNRPS